MRWLHGTSAERAQVIERSSLRAGSFVVEEERGHPAVAKYSKYAALGDHSAPVVLVLELPDDAVELETLGTLTALLFGPPKNYRTTRVASAAEIIDVQQLRA